MTYTRTLTCGTKAGSITSLTGTFSFKPLLNDITLKDIGDCRLTVTFKKGDLVSNLPGGIFIKTSEKVYSTTNIKYGYSIRETRENVKLIASVL